MSGKIVAICPMQMWTGVVEPESRVFLELPSNVDLQKEVANCHYGENHTILINHLLALGAKEVKCPIEEIYV